MHLMKQSNGTAQNQIRTILLGTDWHTDCDDAVAIRVLAWAQRRGMVQIGGISIDSAMACSVSSLRAFLKCEGVAEVPVALDHGAFDYGGETRYQPRLAAGRDWRRENDGAEESVRMYRRLLAASGAPVDLVEIGFSQVLAALLTSEADEFSALSGAELVRQKVGRLWVMGGNWGENAVPEFNFSKTEKARNAICTVLRCCPVPITFLGFEVAETVLSGGILRDCAWEDALRDVLADHGSAGGRPSWDPLLVYLACVGNAEAAGFRCVRGWATVDPETGCSRFRRDSGGRHCYVVKAYPDAVYRNTLDSILWEYSCYLNRYKTAFHRDADK